MSATTGRFCVCGKERRFARSVKTESKIPLVAYRPAELGGKPVPKGSVFRLLPGEHPSPENPAVREHRCEPVTDVEAAERTGEALFLNHYVDCPRRGDFKRRRPA
jgi:hypothetical protein